VSVAILFAGFASAALFAATPGRGGDERALIDASRFRPMVAFHELETVVDSEFVTISGVIFSRSPIETVTVGERAATLSPAESKDLVALPLAPKGASELPFRTAFEVPDAVLSRLGANDLDVRAMTTDGKSSDVHRVTVLRMDKDRPTQP
jgi:hypothetical protein